MTMVPRMQIKLRLTQKDHALLQQHLFSGDGFESVAIALCGRRRSHSQHCIAIHSVFPIPNEECKSRTVDSVTWPTEHLIPFLERASRDDLAVLKIHSHPQGYPHFSSIDDESDAELFKSVFIWTDSEFPHASAIMLPGGRIFGRGIFPDGTFQPIDSILIPGDNIEYWIHERGELPSFTRRNAQLFGPGTTQKLRKMSAAVVGCSGTGSPVIEQLARLGIGRLVLVDPDKVEEKNLNRILNSTQEDGIQGRLKVEIMSRAIASMGFGTKVDIIPENLATPEAVKAVAECDVLFGCMDGAEGRNLLNRIAAFYVLPYFDVGISLDADEKGGISQAVGAVHYVRPDGSTLLDRGVYTAEEVQAEGLMRTSPDAYRDRVKAKYIHGVDVERPAVISINMQAASMAVNEFLARLHPYRIDHNSKFATIRFSFVHEYMFLEKETDLSGRLSPFIGRGDMDPYPLLSMPELSEVEGTK